MSQPCSRPQIVVAESLSEPALERLRSVGDVLEPPPRDAAALRQAVSGADALVVRTYTSVDAELLAAAPRLKVIGRAGVGLDNIDVPAARARGIEVVHTPGASASAVAELALGLIIAIRRMLLAGDQAVREGRLLAYRDQHSVEELGGQTLGIVGMGRTGRATARRCCLGLGMTILFNDIIPITGLDFPAESVSKPDLYARADVVSLHVPLTDLTRGLINGDSLAGFRPGSVLINTSRGGVVDSAALADALAAGRLAGAGIDVFEEEPPGPGHPLLGAPNCLLSPHVAARTRQALEAMNNVVDDVLAVLAGRPPRFPAP